MRIKLHEKQKNQKENQARSEKWCHIIFFN